MIKIENISVTYPDSKNALDNISYEFEKRKTYALFGANGAGKSTLLKTLLGIVPINRGRAFIDDIEICSKNLRKIRQNAGLVFQNSDDQLFSATVEDDLNFGLLNMDLTQDEIKKTSSEYAEKFNITHLLKRSPQRLSEGEKKRVCICSVIAMKPSVLLLDEPTAQLDPRGKREIEQILKSLNQTLIMATHDIDFAKKTCESCLILKDGCLAFAGKIDSALQNEKLIYECGLA